MDNRGYSSVSVGRHTILASKAKVANYIDADKPVIWFHLAFDESVLSELADNDAVPASKDDLHAVIVYGYKIKGSEYTFLVHFGWNNCSEIYVVQDVSEIYACWR